MRKIISILLFFILAIISIAFVSAAGTDTAISRFNMPGCEDQTLPYFCSISETKGIPYYCTPSLTIVSNCTKCGCPPKNQITAIWCTANKCQAPSGTCTSCTGKLEDSCKDCLGVCYWNSTACNQCPDKTTEMIDCSFYGKERTCAEDMCFLGKTGFGVGFYESPWVIVNYTCEWDVPLPEEGGEASCRLSYNTINPNTGVISRCRTTQNLGPCVNDVAELKWSKICKNAQGVVTEGSDVPQTTPIPCGKVASPLPFFDILNFIVVAIVLSFYYSCIRNKKLSRK